MPAYLCITGVIALTKVFIDGSTGTTGLRIAERLEGRTDIELIRLSEEERKNSRSRENAMNEAKVVFLCLPDDAAREAVSFVSNPDTVIIDASTAHRTSDLWTYGMPELAGNRERIRASHRIANPGCHASGFIALIAPLVHTGVLAKDVLLSCFSITGYSGGGKKMIAQYEAPERDTLLSAPRQYGLSQMHKHLLEMQKICGLQTAPLFSPIVADFYSGMEVTVPLMGCQVCGGMEAIKEIYRSCYVGPVIRYAEKTDESGFLSALSMSGRDDMEISVYGNEERILLTARFDNLGKGASGAAIQNMNVALDIPETTGLVL